MWLMKVKESQQFQIFASYATDIHANEFTPLIKVLFVPQREDLSFFSFVRGTNLFSVSRFTCSPKKESEKLKNSHFFQANPCTVCIADSFMLGFCDE